MDTKQSYMEKLEAQLNEWTAQIDQLRAKPDGAKADAKLEYQQQIDHLQTKKDQVQGKLNEIKQAGEGAWESLREGVEAAVTDLKAAVDRAMSKFQ